ncbi:MAG: DNA polymerase II large subunit [Nanoarchaeota archaeon]|nr:DNA polymerase II large subunit [Nanoarchaeota archaeon]
MVVASEEMQKYFDELQKKSKAELEIATAAREKGYDPDDKVEIQLAANMAERVVGLISVIAPQIINSGVVERIIELEKEYGVLDWRVALKIAEEVAQEKFCKFKDKKEAIEVGVRVGFAYGTVGVVSSPLEGLISIDIKQRLDGKGEYFCLNYGGPVRNAGGSAAAWSVIIGDYVRKKLGYAEYDPTESEIRRCFTEVTDYHERVTNLQYFPSKRECEFMIQHLPVEVSGDASEDINVSNYKDLPRIPTNKIRSGYCLIHSSCIPLKAPKLWKQLGAWGKDFGMGHWSFLEEFIKIQKEEKAKASGAVEEKDDKKDEKKGERPKIKPVYTYISDLVAGRPVIGHPLANGALRLRYGRSRFSGYSAQCIHPASMHAMNDFIATGTQLKVERPGKGAAFTPCDTIEGPIVKLDDGAVMRLNTEQEAKQVKKRIKEVLYLGDVLVNYGDFFDRAHSLVPPGYCEEWWVQELEKSIVTMFGSLDIEKVANFLDVSTSFLQKILKQPLMTKPTAEQALLFAKRLNTNLHPYWTYFWQSIKPEQLRQLVEWFARMKVEHSEKGIEKMILPLEEKPKRVLELLGVPHIVATEFVVIDRENSAILLNVLYSKHKSDELLRMIDENQQKSTLDILNGFSEIKQRDKCGTFIGGRMGRPEKAKMRKLTGSPHVLFPVGEEGGRLRCFQSALEAGKIRAEFSIYKCDNCNRETVLRVCEVCDQKTRKLHFCKICGVIEEPQCKHGDALSYMKKDIDIQYYFKQMLKKLDTTTYPDLIKGVRGTSNREHIAEHPMKGILRAKHSISVNKDGTIRYDCSELPVTHFKSKEIRVGVEKLKELGYTKDIHGKPLENADQVLEIKPQDIILPCCPDSPDEGCDEILYRTAAFIDEMLVKLYGLPPYYNLKSKEDLVGQLIVGLAPHTSAGTLGRIIGFSKTQAFLSHFLMHAAMRRDCDGDESCLFLLLDAFLDFSRKYLPDSRGSTMDAPLVLTSILNTGEVDDMAFNVDTVWKYPLEFYEAALQYKMPWDVPIEIFKKRLNKPEQYEGLGFTHDTDDLNAGILCSAYKTLPSMEEKMLSQMDLAEKLRAVDEHDVARLVIEKHFIRDIKGNLRKFSQQEFRCVKCNTKFRRPPLVGKCTVCGGKILFTISEGSIVKYLEPSLSLARKYNLPPFLNQSLELVKRRIEGVFGREKEKQEGLGKWFG